jgi:hypothetical protein
LAEIKIDRTETCPVPAKLLGEGAESKGFREVVIQDIRFQTDNVKFRIERYLVPGTQQVIEGTLPAGFDDGQFGPGIRSFCRMLYYQGRVTQNKILKILTGMGVLISAAELGRMIIDVPSGLTEDREEARRAGVEKAGYLQADYTGARVMGLPGHTVVLCNEYFADRRHRLHCQPYCSHTHKCRAQSRPL